MTFLERLFRPHVKLDRDEYLKLLKDHQQDHDEVERLRPEVLSLKALNASQSNMIVAAQQTAEMLTKQIEGLQADKARLQTEVDTLREAGKTLVDDNKRVRGALAAANKMLWGDITELPPEIVKQIDWERAGIPAPPGMEVKR